MLASPFLPSVAASIRRAVPPFLLALGFLSFGLGSAWGQPVIEITNRQIAGSVSPGALEGDTLVFTAAESQNGYTDLNLDLDTNDRVVHLLDLESGAILNLGLAQSQVQSATDLWVRGDLVAFIVRELDQGNTDLNGDSGAAGHRSQRRWRFGRPGAALLPLE